MSKATTRAVVNGSSSFLAGQSVNLYALLVLHAQIKPISWIAPIVFGLVFGAITYAIWRPR